MTDQKIGFGVSLSLLVLLFAINPPLQAVPPQTEDTGFPEREYTGPDGKPLPFRNDAEVLDFLSTASVIDQTNIGTGINRSQKLSLEKGGVLANAIFREVDVTEQNARVGDRTYRVFRDSFLFEPAAYQLGLLLGNEHIPPAVRRRVNGRDGSVQGWLEDVLDEDSEGFRPPDIQAWVRQVRDMELFDNFIYNVDRNGGNILVTSDYFLVMIDHTRGFQEKTDIMNPEKLHIVNKDTWEKFRSVTDDQIRDAVRPYLTPREMSSLLRRRAVIVEHIEGLIEERGEEAVVLP